MGDWPAVGGSVVGSPVTVARWPVAGGRTPLGTSTQGVATNMGLSPASTAMWGSAPILFFLSSEEKEGS